MIDRRNLENENETFIEKYYYNSQTPRSSIFEFSRVSIRGTPFCKVAISLHDTLNAMPNLKISSENWVEKFRLRYSIVKNRLITLTSFLVVPFFYPDGRHVFPLNGNAPWIIAENMEIRRNPPTSCETSRKRKVIGK